jgi:hypothetical protein
MTTADYRNKESEYKPENFFAVLSFWTLSMVQYYKRIQSSIRILDNDQKVSNTTRNISSSEPLKSDHNFSSGLCEETMMIDTL